MGRSTWSDKKKLKIVHFGHKRMPSREGGVEIVVEELATRMAAMGHNVTVINRRGHHVSGAEFDEERQTEYKGVRILSALTIDKKGLAAVSSAFFATIKASFGKYDIDHIHAEGPAAFCWMPKIFGKKVVCTCHGIDYLRPRWKGTFGSKFIQSGEKMMAKYADEIIVLSKGVQEHFKSTYGRNTTLIPNGVVRPDIRKNEILNKKYKIETNGYFLALSRLTKEKGIHLLIEAYRRVKTDKKLVIAGGSSDSNDYVQYLHKLAEGDERIIFTGFVQGQELEELYSNAYVYVLPSELEGMPLSLLEAMSYGNCCLTSDISENKDVIGKYGLTFKTNDEVDMTKCLQNLENKPLIVNEYKANAASYICEKYNWDEVTERTLDLYYK